MSGVMVEYSHISLSLRLRESPPETWQEVQVVPREGETVQVLGETFVVYRVHWWEPPIEQGKPAARIVLRTPEELRRRPVASRTRDALR